MIGGDQILLDFSQPELTREEALVWAAVRDHAGKERAVLGPVIAEITGLDYTTVRAVISHLVSDHARLIASCGKGYYVPRTAEEIAEATRSLRHRGMMIFRRAARLQKTSVEEVFGQARMEFEKAG